jgi:serine/threonine-protein kinase SRPK3
VALKIVPARTSEAKILKHLALASSQTSNPGKNHIVTLFDTFKLNRAETSYDVLVMEPTTGSAEGLKQHALKLNLDAAKMAVRQVAMAMDFLHESGVCHGDFRSGNVCFTIPGLNHLSEADVIRMLGPPELTILERYDGEPLHPLMPRYTVSPSPFPFMGQEVNAKIVDFGQGQQECTFF